jgi:hypothetical protein
MSKPKHIVDSDASRMVPVAPGTAPDYDANNSLMRVIRFIESAPLMADREHYLADTIQFLMPFESLGLYSPSDAPIADPREQDNKNDFQKQNIATYSFGDMHFVRGYVSAGDWTGCFLQLCYKASPFTELGKLTGGNPGKHLRLFLKVGVNTASMPLTVPFNPETGCYEIELWSFDGGGAIRGLLGDRGQAALDEGRLIMRPDLVKGTLDAFTGPGFDIDREVAVRGGNPLAMWDRVREHAMHPIRPLRIETAWANETETFWDNNGGTNHIYEFEMSLRGWNNYLQVGQSKNPHGGFGFLEFRNLYTNYFNHEKTRFAELGEEWMPELGRDLQPYNFDANTLDPVGPPRVKAGTDKREDFFAVEYMDLHILQPDCGIGIHRHRDNQEVFLLLQGRGLMIMGDWALHEKRGRAFESRTMLPGDLALCKTGQLHALYNTLDEPTSLFMFGGYD